MKKKSFFSVFTEFFGNYLKKKLRNSNGNETKNHLKNNEIWGFPKQSCRPLKFLSVCGAQIFMLICPLISVRHLVVKINTFLIRLLLFNSNIQTSTYQAVRERSRPDLRTSNYINYIDIQIILNSLYSHV